MKRYKKTPFLIVLFSLVLIVPTSVYAVMFDFGPLSSSGGTGTATMDISILGSTVTATVDNTSPILLDDFSDANAPGITAFGFDLDPAGLGLTSWLLTAKDNLGVVQTIGSSAAGTWDWILTVNGNVNGIKVGYSPNTDNGVAGALYNPLANGSSALAALPNYFTTAVLTLNFDAAPTLNTDDFYSPYVRMQNVGDDGEGSLKLPGYPPGTPPPPPGANPTPEPATMVLMGIGLIGLGIGIRKKAK